MKPVGSRPIWFETVPQLTARWFELQPERVRIEVVSPATATERAAARAEKLTRYTRLTPLRAIRTPREWDTRWNAEAAWQMLESAIDAFGWDAVRDSSRHSRVHAVHAALYETERESILLQDHILQQKVDALQHMGLLIPFTLDDMATIDLCQELFSLAAEKMGRQPSPWLDELARFEFTRRVLGLPFSPMILIFAEDV